MAASRKKIHKRHKIKKAGSSPGVLEYTGSASGKESEVMRSFYNGEHLLVRSSVSPMKHLVPFQGTQWVDVRGVQNTRIVAKISEEFGIHPLLQEDIVNVYQRTRFEEQDEGDFIVFKLIQNQGAPGTETAVLSEQIALFFTGDTLVSFQENPDDSFSIIRERLKKENSRMRTGGVLYLVYAILDLALDHYIHFYHAIDQQTELLEEQTDGKFSQDFKLKVHSLRQELMQLRRLAFPMRELLSKLAREAAERNEPDKSPYIQDLQDHLMLLLEDIEECKDRLNGLYEWYNMHLQHKTNQVVQTLTVISTIFIPITFVAGVYGMNFKAMPELDWKYGYVFAWGIMLVMTGLMGLYFRSKRWF
jgi:magnesium transporter